MSDLQGKGPVAWMAAHRIAPNILMVVFLIGGLFMTTRIKQEVFPDFTLDSVTVTVPFPGASPEEVEQGVILAIEEEVRAIEGIEEIYSTAAEGRATVLIEALAGADLQRVYQDVKQAVDRIDTFPEDTREETVALSTRRRSVIDLQIYGDVSEWTLRQAAEQVRDGLLQNPGITQVDLAGVREMEIHIEIPQDTLREFGLTLSQVGQVLLNSAQDRSGGSIETGAGEILLRVQERREWAREYENIPIIAPATGAMVRLGDIATVREGFEESDTFATFNGMPAIGIDILRVGEETPIGVSKAVMESLPGIMATLPPGIAYAVTDDDSEIYRQRLELLLKNGFVGLCLVFIILSLFLEFKLAFWVAMGIPTSFLGTLLFLPMFDVSINMISMFAFILALGIVVDDAIVAGENIYEHRQRGDGFLRSAILGARDIAMPVSFSILTNIAAFLPLSFIPGVFGKIWAVIPVVVTSAFLISWVEALFILPAHLAHVKEAGQTGFGAKLHRMQRAVANTMVWVAEHLYGPVLSLALRWRYLTIAILAAIFVIVLAIPMSGRMGFILMPQVEGEFALATARLPVGAPVKHAEYVRDRLATAAEAVLAENGGEALGTGVFSLVDESLVEVRTYLVESSLRKLSTADVTNLWREKLGGEIPGLESLRFEADAGGPGRGPKLSVELSHRNVRTLERASEDLAVQLEEFDRVKDVDDGYTPGKVQLDFKANEEARSLGLDASAIARQVRASYYGEEPIRQQRGRNEVTVKVRLPLDERTNEANVEDLMIYTPDGGEVPLYQVAQVSRGRAYTNIDRRNGRRVVTVTANVEPVSETSKVLASLEEELLPRLIANYPGLSYSFEGRQADMRESMESFYYTCSLALFAIFVLLAVPFRSYVQPIIVMTAIPFAIVGAILGHLIMGFSLSVISIMGIIALSGVVINDGLVMVDYANGQRRLGLGPKAAVVNAGIRRFRPIMLTTWTTFGGLAPMIFETSRQARFLIPMAISLGYGILFATFITLLLVPCLYLVVEDMILLFRAAPHALSDEDSLTSRPQEE
jgi:multidrug efflux pump subunit AcrB